MSCAILLGLAAPVLAQSSGASIVDEALKGVQEDQARDAERVRRMVDEAVKGTEAGTVRAGGHRSAGTGRAASLARGYARGPAGRLSAGGSGRQAGP